MNILFLNENPLPAEFTKGTIAAKELRLRAAIPEIDAIHVIARRGRSMVKPGIKNKLKGPLEKKIIIHLLPPWPYYASGIALFFYGLYVVKKYRISLIEAESPLFSGPAAVIIGKIYQIPTIVEIRSTFHELAQLRFPFIPRKIKQFFIDLIYWPTVRQATGVIANSRFYEKFLKQHNIESIIVNPGLQYVPQVMSKKNTSHIIIGYIGRLVKEKNVDVLIRAFAEVLKSTDKEKVSLEIAGDGPLYNHLNQLCKELRIKKYIKLLGFQDNYQCLKRWSIAVNPISVTTPLEMANVEAAYMGVPMIVFGKDDFPETVSHEVSGIKIWPIDQSLLTQTLIRLINDHQLRAKLSTNGRKFAQKNYSFEQQVLNLRKLYKQIKLVK